MEKIGGLGENFQIHKWLTQTEHQKIDPTQPGSKFFDLNPSLGLIHHFFYIFAFLKAFSLHFSAFNWPCFPPLASAPGPHSTPPMHNLLQTDIKVLYK